MSWMRTAAVVVALYVVLTALLLARLPLWLDEVLQLYGTQPTRHASEVVDYVPRNPGGVPLGYLVQWWWLRAAGLSTESARVPAALFGVAACLLTALTARKLGLARPWMAATLFAVLPLTLRYSTEARPYSQAIAITLAATLLFLRMTRGTTPMLTGVYAVVLIAGVYTQPFTLAIGGAHLAWAVMRRDRTLVRETGLAVFVAALSFLPWFVYAREGWRKTSEVSEFQFVANWKTPLMFLREITGGGYWGAGLLAWLCWLGARSPSLVPDHRRLLLLMMGVPVVAGFAADALFGYFVAIRQFLWILPPAAVLAAAAFDYRRRTAIVLLAGLFAVFAIKSWKYYRSPAEDWEAAAHAIRDAGSGAACIDVDSKDQAILYEVFARELVGRECSGPPERGRMILAISPYAQPDSHPLRQLLAGGFRIAAERRVGGTRIFTLER